MSAKEVQPMDRESGAKIVYLNRSGLNRIAHLMKWLLIILAMAMLIVLAPFLFSYLKKMGMGVVGPTVFSVLLGFFYYGIVYKGRQFFWIANRVELQGRELRMISFFGRTLIQGKMEDIFGIDVDEHEGNAIRISMKNGSSALVDGNLEQMGQLLETLLAESPHLGSIMEEPEDSALWSVAWQKEPDAALIGNARRRVRENVGKRIQIPGPGLLATIIGASIVIGIVSGLMYGASAFLGDISRDLPIMMPDQAIRLIGIVIIGSAIRSVYGVATTPEMIFVDDRGVTFRNRMGQPRYYMYSEIKGIYNQGAAVRLEFFEGEQKIDPGIRKLGWLLERIIEKAQNLEKLELGYLTNSRKRWGKRINYELINAAEERVQSSHRSGPGGIGPKIH
ncbi:MAG TPA: hypothetical protein DEA96_11725 [Leptospiraceae bacterium]|nr:hypothetical protein [Spirochaetaceae bacterium]HBS05629.1 hypothetical protein [Leptospiraceae bacterium]|tara:strand:+ start:9931 stop:11106 length:1176 start_codon:yes stop_codon:yes gene_type:complete